MDDYSGAFRPDFDLPMLSRRGLAVLGREYLLDGHLIDRSGLPQVLSRWGQDAMRDVSIDEWMGASPIYTRRTQRAMSFSGDDVPTIFKGLQFDVGAPHQFMDFRYRVHDEHSGEFWLASCGALMDVEPMGESFVQMMCHDIEDPTFDATAVATNPRAQVRPIHRPPRVPADRTPHCHWRVTIDPSFEPVTAHPNTELVAASRAAHLDIPWPASGEPGGWDDYAGEFDPDFQLELLSHTALAVVDEEFCLQGHLLVRAYLLCVSQRFGEEVLPELATEQFVGVAGVVAERLVRTMGLQPGGLEAVAKVFQLHPCLRPRAYVDLRVELEEDHVRIAIGGCPALDENDPFSWFAIFDERPPAAIECIAETVDPRARCRSTAIRDDERLAWEIVVDPAAEPATERPEVTLTKFSTGAAFVLREPGPG